MMGRSPGFGAASGVDAGGAGGTGAGAPGVSGRCAGVTDTEGDGACMAPASTGFTDVPGAATRTAPTSIVRQKTAYEIRARADCIGHLPVITTLEAPVQVRLQLSTRRVICGKTRGCTAAAWPAPRAGDESSGGTPEAVRAFRRPALPARVMACREWPQARMAIMPAPRVADRRVPNAETRFLPRSHRPDRWPRRGAGRRSAAAPAGGARAHGRAPRRRVHRQPGDRQQERGDGRADRHDGDARQGPGRAGRRRVRA